jgi:hypothetical protein
MPARKSCNRRSKTKNRDKFVGAAKKNLRGSVERWQIACPATRQLAKKLGLSLIIKKKDGHKRLKTQKELNRDIKRSRSR